MKFQTNKVLSCYKFEIDDAGSLLNHTFAASLRVAGKYQYIISSGVY